MPVNSPFLFRPVDFITLTAAPHGRKCVVLLLAVRNRFITCSSSLINRACRSRVSYTVTEVDSVAAHLRVYVFFMLGASVFLLLFRTGMKIMAVIKSLRAGVYNLGICTSSIYSYSSIELGQMLFDNRHHLELSGFEGMDLRT
jgi:hypothetical protein